MSDKGHIAITVGGTTTPLVIDPQSYQVVDVVDFAPQAISGSPAFSELGLYLNVAQDGFGHGLGQWRFGEPKSYAYSGNYIDTRFDSIQLFTDITSLSLGSSPMGSLHEEFKVATFPTTSRSSPVTLMNNSHFGGILNGITRIYSPNNGWVGVNDLNNVDTKAADGFRDFLWNGSYMFASCATHGTANQQLHILWVGQVSAIDTGTNVVTFTGTTFSTNLWQNGFISFFDGSAADTNLRAVASSTATTVTYTGTDPTGTIVGRYALLGVPVGVAANLPYNYTKMLIFGGRFWAIEQGTNYLHYWSELTGSDAEGGGKTDLGAVAVGPLGGKLLNMAVYNNQLWVFREEGAWVIGEDLIAYHTLDISAERHPSNFYALAAWNGFLFFNIRNSIYKFRSGLQDITPPPVSEFPPYSQFGRWTSLVPRGNTMFAVGRANQASAEGDTNETTADFASLFAYDGVGWHKLVTPAQNVRSDEAFVALDAFTDKLYVSVPVYSGGPSGVGTSLAFTFQLQEFSNLPYVSFPTSGNHFLYTSYYDLGMKRIPKSFASLTLEGNFPTNTSVAVSFRTDETTTWTTLGTFTSNLQEVDFPTGTTGGKVQFRLNLQTTSASVTPLIRAVIMKCMMRPDVLYGVSCQVLVSDDISDANGLSMGYTAAQIRAALAAARASVSPITLKDVHGNSASAYLSSLQYFLTEYEHLDRVEQVAKCTFVYV